ncbi:MAG TPA: GAF domain-containing protein [Candidatus Methanoperedens sp.]|nr:GAF domain-containing protein [Candidatus Methanoperedens sp.]
MKTFADSLGFRLTVASYLVVAVFMSVAGVTVYRASKDSIKMGAMGMVSRMADELALAPGAPPEELGDRLLRLKVRRSGSTWIMDREGNLLYNPDPLFREEYIAKKKNFGNVQVVLQAAAPRASGQGTSKEKLVDIAQKYEEGFGTYKQFGEERILAFRSLPARGLLIGVDEPVSSANSELERVKKYISYTALVSALLIMVFSLLSIRIIIRPYYREVEDLNASLQHSNAQLEEINARLAVSNRNLTTLYEVGLGMRHTLALPDILALIVNGAHKVLDVDRIAIFLPRADGAALELRSWAGGAAPGGTVQVPLAAHGGALAAAYQRKEPVVVTHGQRLPPSLRLAPPAAGEPFLRSSAFVALPLVVKERAVGVVVVDNKARRAPIGAEQVNLLGIFANQAAVAIDNARLYEQLRQKISELDARVDQLSILHQIGNSMQRDITRHEALGFILRGILEGIGFSQAAVALVDRADGSLRGELILGVAGADAHGLRVPLTAQGNLLVKALSLRGPVGIVHRTRDALLAVIEGPLEAGAWSEGADAAGEGARAAIMVVPLIAREEVVGVIAVSRTEPPVIRRHEVELLLLYANTAGLTVERADLYARMHRSIEQLEITDQVSHLATLSHGRQQTEAALARCAAAGKPCAGLMIGIDAFGEYNDRCGYERGDRSLGEVGEIIKGTLREEDIALRYGGRLLAVVLPGAGREQAAPIAERIREDVRRHRFPGHEGRRDQQLSVSIGCGVWRPGAQTGGEAGVFTILLDHLRRAEAGGGDGVFTGEA